MNASAAASASAGDGIPRLRMSSFDSTFTRPRTSYPNRTADTCAPSRSTPAPVAVIQAASTGLPSRNRSRKCQYISSRMPANRSRSTAASANDTPRYVTRPSDSGVRMSVTPAPTPVRSILTSTSPAWRSASSRTSAESCWVVRLDGRLRRLSRSAPPRTHRAHESDRPCQEPVHWHNPPAGPRLRELGENTRLIPCRILAPLACPLFDVLGADELVCYGVGHRLPCEVRGLLCGDAECRISE